MNAYSISLYTYTHFSVLRQALMMRNNVNSIHPKQFIVKLLATPIIVHNIVTVDTGCKTGDPTQTSHNCTHVNTGCMH